MWWWTGDPSGSAVEEDLRSGGAHLVVTQLVMGRPFGRVDADAWLAGAEPRGVQTTVVADAATFRALTDVETTALRRLPAPAEVLSEEWSQLQADLGSSSAFALLASLDGTPALVGRCRLFGSARLPRQ